MNVLIIGGTGFISTKITEFLLNKGFEITMLNRGITENKFAHHDKVKIFRGDRNDIKILNQIIDAKKYDAVYDMVAYEPDDSETVYQVFKGKIRRFIHCSTVSVYMISNEVSCPITEDQTEGAIMPHFQRNPFGMDYGIKKRECEKFLWKVHDDKIFPVTTVRPPYVCGPGDPARRDYFWIERIMDGNPLLVPGSGDFATQTIWVDDLARAFVDLLDHKGTIGEAFNAAGDEIFSLNDYLRRLARLLKKEIKLAHIDQQVFDKLPISHSEEGDVFTFNTRRTAVFSTDKIKSAIGFKSTPFEEWMPRTIDYFLNEHTKHSSGYENREEEIEIAIEWLDK